MNLAFYGLKRRAFTESPDPDFLYLTPRHQEALAQLVYGVRERKGFMLLVGDVGTGKTTLLHALRRRLDDQTAVALVVNSKLPFEGLLEYILEDFGIAKPAESHAQRLMRLQTFLTERHRAGQATVLIIDEAQNLDTESLEQIRLLSNFETASAKILQIILAGQPELLATLGRPELRQLMQRIALRCRLPRLGADYTRAYIQHRLQLAGAADLGLFTEPAIARIARYANGVPRLINIVCDHSMIIGYADQVRRIERRAVEEAIAYLDVSRRPDGIRRRGRMSPLRWGLLVAWMVEMAGIVALGVYDPELLADTIYTAVSWGVELAHAASLWLPR